MNYSESELIHYYQEMLRGKRKNLPGIFQGSGRKSGLQTSKKRKDTDTNSKIALVFFRYAVEHILCWTPEETQFYFNFKIAEQLKLTNLLQYLKFPPELSKTKNINYIAHLLYPNRIPCDEKQLCIKLYNAIVNTPSKDFPEGYFEHAEGAVRAKYCLLYALTNHVSIESVADLYEFFSDKNRGEKLLRELHLADENGPYKMFYDHPLNYLHYSLPEHQRDSLLYYYYLKFADNSDDILGQSA